MEEETISQSGSEPCRDLENLSEILHHGHKPGSLVTRRGINGQSGVSGAEGRQCQLWVQSQSDPLNFILTR